MKIIRISTKEEFESAKISHWAPVNYGDYPELVWLEPEEGDKLKKELYDLLIDKYQLVKLRTQDGKETFFQAVRGQCDDSIGRGRTDQFEYVPCLFELKGLTEMEIKRQLEKEINQTLWGCGFKLGYLEVLVPWG